MVGLRSMSSLLRLAVLGVAVSTAGAALAQTPGNIKLLVGFPAGGTIDVVARLIGECMRREFGGQVVIENTTGAGGLLAAQALKRADPDGRTLMVAPDHTMVVIPLTMAQPGVDMQKDFVPVGRIADYAGGFAVSGNAIRTLDDFLRAAKADPAKASVGIAAAGSKPQFALAAIAREKGVALTAVPYRGSVPMLQDLVGGHLPAGVTALGDFLEAHTAGKLQIVAITGESRAPQLPNIPTAIEQGYPMKLNFWLGLFAPARTPDAALGPLTTALESALKQPEIADRMRSLAFEPRFGNSAEMAKDMAADFAYWGPLVEASGWVKQ